MTRNPVPPILEFQGDYRWLSNFAPLKGHLTLEHFYQAEKTLDPVWRYRIMMADTPAEAARLKAGQATTLVEVEIARREGEKTAAKFEVYVTNPAAYELERLRLLAQVYNDKTVIIVPEGSDQNLFVNHPDDQPTVVTEP